MLKFQQENVDLTQDFHCFSEGKCIPFWGKNTFVRVHIQAIDANISARILWLEDDLDKKHEIFINTNSQTHSFILRGSEEILVSAEANLRSGKALVKKGADTAFLEFNPNIPFFWRPTWPFLWQLLHLDDEVSAVITLGNASTRDFDLHADNIEICNISISESNVLFDPKNLRCWCYTASCQSWNESTYIDQNSRTLVKFELQNAADRALLVGRSGA